MAITPGGALNSVPAPLQQALTSNYIDFTSAATAGWAQQYLPDLMEKEAEVFGNRTISGFLAQVGAEESMTADQVIWSEQGRLHLSYIATMSNVSTKADATAGGQITIVSDIDGNTGTTVYSTNDHGIRVNDILLLADSNTTTQGVVTAVTAATGIISVGFYGANTATAAGITATTASALRVLVVGSEYAKGTNGRVGQNEPSFLTFNNKPIILKDKYSISGSDTAQLGWVEVTGESGQNGYLWYLKAEGDTRARFTDYVEMAMIESVSGVAGSTLLDSELFGAVGNTFGTQGLFAAIESRGNMSSGITGVNPATDLAEFDAILAEFDKQGAIEENMMFIDRTTSLAIDDMLASMNSYGAGGTSYGVFDNSEDMALNLGFSGFRRGSYDFYKSDWKYLNDFATRGAINAMNTTGAIRGIIVPAGTSTVYDQMLGKNLKRPFLHVRYRASQTDDRKMKTWVTGSVGATTSELDAMEIHYLSERCLITQGANNFMLLN
jgi:hypothetical protein